jgi:hypothetical protein
MNICTICKKVFTKKRKEQVLCSAVCRQKNNAKKRKGQKTGRQQKEYKKRLTKDGYLRQYSAAHPFANGRKEIHVHVMIMELSIGRALEPGEVVHHKNEIKTDNRLENLELMNTADHSRLHQKSQINVRKRNMRGQYA